MSKPSKKSLFEDESAATKEKLTINRKFKESFEKRKQREELDRAKAKFGQDTLKKLAKKQKENSDEDASGSDDSSSIVEDEDGMLVTNEFADKFLETISKIRAKHPDIYDPKKKFFKPQDFGTLPETPKKESSLTYKDLVRSRILEGKPLEDEEEVAESNEMEEETQEQNGEDEQEKAKKAFLKAFEEENQIKDEGDFLTVKKKSSASRKSEKEAFKEFLKREKSKNGDVKMLKKTLKKKNQETEADKFLRKYILCKGWIDEEDPSDQESNEENLEKENGAEDPEEEMVLGKINELADEEDEKRDQEMRLYEKEFNFRFEEPDGRQIVTYERQIEDTLRNTTSKRAEKRKEKQEREKAEKMTVKEELSRIRSLQEKEILERVKRIQTIAGIKEENEKKTGLSPNKVISFLNEDFDEKKHEAVMEQMFGDDYYESGEEDEEEIENIISKFEEEEDKRIRGIEEKEESKREEEEKTKEKEKEDTFKNALEVRTSVPVFMRHNLKENEVQALKGHSEIWWYCDSCWKGLQPFEPRFDCMTCDFTLCKKCSEIERHPHKLKRFIVPKDCTPPSDQEIQKILEKFSFCVSCKGKMSEDSDAIYTLKKDSSVRACEQCVFSSLSSEYSIRDWEMHQPNNQTVESAIKSGDFHKLPDIDERIANDEELKKLIDGYYLADFEDIIAGGLKTRFKYGNVKKEDFGLTDADIIFCDEPILNEFLSHKFLAPYAEDDNYPKSVRKRMHKLRANVKKSAAENFENFIKSMEQNKDPKKNKGMLQKRSFKKAEEQRKATPRVQVTDLSMKDDAEELNDPSMVSDSRLASYKLNKTK